MTDAAAASWPALLALGAGHGINPAMGWLFAVALGLHRRSRAVLAVSLLPIAIGHAVSIAAVAGLLIAAGYLVPHDQVRIGSGVVLLGWAAYHWRFGSRHRVRFGMQTGLVGLAVWSCLMATAHGAGLMLWPALMPLCLPEASSPGALGMATAALAGVAIHSGAMLAVTAAVAGLVYEWVGLEVLRRAWINVDMLWMAALVVTGLLLLLT
jgi:hypothetical protein